MKLDGDSYTSELKNIKLEESQVSFDEQLKFRENDLQIAYTGRYRAMNSS